MTSSRIPGFHRLGREERLDRIVSRAGFDAAEARSLGARDPLPMEVAEALSENVIGLFPLPLGVAMNFRVNGCDRIVPMAIEESSVVAAASHAARILREGFEEGIRAEADEPLVEGQIQVLDLDDLGPAADRVLESSDEIVERANRDHPRLRAAGGGARAVSVELHPETSVGPMLLVHLLVDVADAMGANAVNSMCESVADLVAERSGGRVGLRILSNFCDRRLVRARGRVSADLLSESGIAGIVEASAMASVSPRRAVTHNKGILNGVDAFLVATGNDWRSVESAAHAFAARSGVYRPLATWERSADGDLLGTLEMPMPVGVVGGATRAHPQARRALAIAGVSHGRELAEIAGAVGLAQNLAALRALAEEGIQAGHMALHAANLAVEAGAKGRAIEIVARRLEAEGRIERDRAREIVSGCASGCGKAILLGEHAVVYGHPAIAVPAPAARTCVSVVEGSDPGVVHAEGIDTAVAGKIFGRACELLGAEGSDRLEVRIEGDLPIGVGMGSSAALGVALLRALAGRAGRDLDLEELRELATELERISHGNPSGIDPAVVASERPILFRRGEPIEWLEIPGSLPLLAADTGTASDTAAVVAAVARRRAEDRTGVDALFEEIGRIVERGAEAIRAGDLHSLGAAMNANQECLQALNVSSEPAERLIDAARRAGALGAKVSGAGRGGIVVVLASPGEARTVQNALIEVGVAGVHRFEEGR